MIRSLERSHARVALPAVRSRESARSELCRLRACLPYQFGDSSRWRKSIATVARPCRQFRHRLPIEHLHQFCSQRRPSIVEGTRCVIVASAQTEQAPIERSAVGSRRDIAHRCIKSALPDSVSTTSPFRALEISELREPLEHLGEVRSWHVKMLRQLAIQTECVGCHSEVNQRLQRILLGLAEEHGVPSREESNQGKRIAQLPKHRRGVRRSRTLRNDAGHRHLAGRARISFLIVSPPERLRKREMISICHI